MKLPKRIYFVAAVLLFVGGAGTGVALAMQPEEPKKVVVEQSASVTPQGETVEAVVEQETATEPVVQEEESVEPQETLQEEAERRTREYASKFGLDDDKQWNCFNQKLSTAGYENESEARRILEELLKERRNEQGGYIIIDCSQGFHTRTIYL